MNRLAYFGKLPGRGDFVKAGTNPALLQQLDDWLTQTMDLLSVDPRWKLNYDALAPIYCAFIGPRRNRAIAGHIAASHDQSRRRFPFLLFSTMEVNDSAHFVALSPLLLSPLWQQLAHLSTALMSQADPASELHAAANNGLEFELDGIACDAALTDFLDAHSVGALDALLAQTGYRGSLRQIMLALGLLLQPVMASRSSRLDKSLRLPLPADPHYRDQVATFWLHLITPFLTGADFELALFIAGSAAKPMLILGFSGASAQTLHATLDPRAGLEYQIAFDDLEWVEAEIEHDYALKQLAAYLAQANLSLTSAHASFRAAFLGA